MKLIHKVDKLIMDVWKNEKLTNEEKFDVVKKLEEVQMLLQGDKL